MAVLQGDARRQIAEQAKWALAARSLSDYATITSHGLWKPARFHKELCRHLEMLEAGTIDRLMVNMPPRHGKALEVHTPILTQRGWLEIGHIVPGDKVYGVDGKLCNVVAVSPVWHDRALYEVSTDDGYSVLADEEHEWVVRLCRKRKHIIKVHTTKYLAERTCARKPMVKRSAPLEMQETLLPVDPYVLGLWLGDGDTASAAVTIGHQDQEFILGKLAERGCNISRHIADTHFGLLGLQVVLRQAGVLGNKHIPDIYMGGSMQQRIDLLNGLIDSDGYVAKDGQVEFCNINKALTMQVQELVWSLGVKCSMSVSRATCNGKDCGEKYRLSFYYSQAASLPRKRANCRDGVKQKDTYLSFKRAGRGDTVCIQVDSSDHQFLCGKSFIPTHNSFLISETFPSWFLGKNPDCRVLLTAYDQALAEKFGRGNRMKLEEFGSDIFNLEISKLKSSQTEWELFKRRGGIKSSPIGAGITGFGADLLIIDDPHKNAQEADSETIRQQIWDEWSMTLSTRLEGKRLVVIVATRWHDDDLCGRLLKNEPGRWTVLSLPALAENNDPLGREPGEPLWPENGFDKEAYEAILRQSGSRAFAALYQQRPTPEGGNIIKGEWIKKYETLPPHFDRMWQSWDMTFKSGTETDYVVGQVWGKLGSEYYLVDQIRARMSFTQSLQAVLTMSARWPKALAKLVEDKANGPAIIDVLKRQINGIIAVNPGRADKVERCHAVEALWEAGNVLIPAHNAWAGEFVDELVAFPAGAHDDQVDAMTQALNWIMGKAARRIRSAVI